MDNKSEVETIRQAVAYFGPKYVVQLIIDELIYQLGQDLARLEGWGEENINAWRKWEKGLADLLAEYPHVGGF